MKAITVRDEQCHGTGAFGRARARPGSAFATPLARANYFCNSFVPRTVAISLWNTLPLSLVSNSHVPHFRSHVWMHITHYLCYFMYPLLFGINFHRNYTTSGKKKMLRKATKVHVYVQCFSLSFSKPERTS